MKVTIRSAGDQMTVYIPKKDLELKVTEKDSAHVFGGILKLENGLVLDVPPQAEMPRLPLTVNAKKVAS